MKIDIYTSISNGSKYLSVPKGTALADIIFSADIDSDLLTLSPFRTRLDIHADKEHNTLDQSDLIEQINAKGYAVHGAKFHISLAAQ